MTHISSVRVAVGRADPTVLFDVLEGVVHEASIASSITILPRAVHQLLLTQAGELPSFLEHLTLQCSSGTECPTRAALPLVLYLWRDGLLAFSSLFYHEIILESTIISSFTINVYILDIVNIYPFKI